ncbi:hypothetical protein Leryth_004024 [Lithospermum erythrorhizon]|nr:hypothetical protein Leryth_004024 [Lithospermum erythrorhizon]
MSDSREDSPDWVKSFKAPTQSILTLSSGSESPLDDDPVHVDDDEDEDDVSLSKLFKKDEKAVVSDKNDEESPQPKVKLQNEKNDGKQTPGRKRKRQDLPLEKQGDPTGKNVKKGKAPKKSKAQEMESVWALSSDSESCPDDSLGTEHHQKELADYDLVQHVEEGESKVAVFEEDEKPPHNMVSALKSPKKKLKKDTQSIKEKEENKVVIKENDDEINIQEEDTTEKQGPQVSSSRMSLVLSEKVQRTKALVECEGDSIDLSGDVGAVGRIMMSESPSGDHDMLLDLKGTIYKTTIVPSRTFCVVTFGPSEAKIEAIMNDFIQLKPQSNVYEAETMVEGTLEGFSFDSEEEPDHPRAATGRQNGKDEAGEEQPKSKGKAKKKPEKTTVVAGKKPKAEVKKPPKKAKKTQVPQKSKTKK